MYGVNSVQVETARSVDLLTYLREREPGELVRSSPNEWRTKTHGSLVLSHGLWYWHRAGFGGKSALDYLIKVRGMGFTDAVRAVSGECFVHTPLVETQKIPPRKLQLPKKEWFPAKAYAYLQKRGIHGDLKRDCSGSDKRYGFSLAPVSEKCNELVVTESPIDALSHATLFRDFDAYRLSPGGVSDIALISFVERQPQIKNVSLCLDNDEAGRAAMEKISVKLEKGGYSVILSPPEQGKDYNEMLLLTKQHQKQKTKELSL